MIADPTAEYPRGRAVVMDWGIAKELRDSQDTQLTEVWTVIGTPQYCSPEQLRPFVQVRGNADIYALGMVMYEMYAGRQFFAGWDKQNIIRWVCDETEENELHFDRPADAEFQALVRKAIAKSPTHRYQRIEDFLHDLEAYRESIGQRDGVTATLGVTKAGPPQGQAPPSQAGNIHARARGAPLDSSEHVYETLREDTASDAREDRVMANEMSSALRELIEETEQPIFQYAGKETTVEASPAAEASKALRSSSFLFSRQVFLPGALLLTILFLFPVSGRFFLMDLLRGGTGFVRQEVVERASPLQEGQGETPSLPFEAIEQPRGDGGSSPPQPRRAALATAGPEPLSLRPLYIIRTTPPVSRELVVAEGQRLHFAVEVEGEEEGVRCVWFLNGKKQAEGKNWSYHPGFDDAGTDLKRVTVVVGGAANLKEEKTWSVRVQNVDRSPVITRVLPSTDIVEIADGEFPEFSVTASDPDKNDHLLYVWSVNGREAARGIQQQFQALSANPPYIVTVEILDDEGRKAQLAWTVTPKATPWFSLASNFLPRETRERTKPEGPLASSANVESPAIPQLSEGEIKAWLETYRRAWEEKQVEALVRLGEISSQDVSRLKHVLDEYKNFRVALKDVILHYEGARATVRFTRVDTVDGQVLSHPPLELTLEKEANGGLRRRE
jgi:hypothetical protein